MWELETSGGIYTAEVLVSAMGPLTEPKLPDVHGLAGFRRLAANAVMDAYEFALPGAAAVPA